MIQFCLFIIVAPIFGIIAASFGGVIRDVFFAQVPSILRRGQLYAISAALGSVAYVLLFALGADTTVGFVICVAVTFVVRIASVRYNIVSM